MPGLASATGLISARVRPIHRAKPKTGNLSADAILMQCLTQKVELSGSTVPAPFALRPFAGLFNPYPYGCSVLCNHPADGEAKDVLRRAKETWATEGKALLLPEEMEMIRAGLLAAGGGVRENVENIAGKETTDAMAVPEELFRKYTETDSRPLTPAPTLASGPASTHRATQDDRTVACNPRERTTLVLDLRAKSQAQESETFTWHALTLEPPPIARKSGGAATYKLASRPRAITSTSSPVPAPPSPIAEACEMSSSRMMDEDGGSSSDGAVIVRRRGKRLRKRKRRRGSTYGQQSEVCDPLEPTETQVSQIADGSRRSSTQPCTGDTDVPASLEKTAAPMAEQATLSSFIAPEILKHLCRELDREKVESEFSSKRRIAYEEALRVKGEVHVALRGSRQPVACPSMRDLPRLFSRQAARFELLDSRSLKGITPLEYIGRYVFVASERKLIFGRAFNRFNEDAFQDTRFISPSDVEEALEEVIGKALTEERKIRLRDLVGDITESLNFREWCGLCALVERLLCPLPSKDVDPPAWLERTDFEALERRLDSTAVDPRLALLLREIRDR